MTLLDAISQAVATTLAAETRCTEALQAAATYATQIAEAIPETVSTATLNATATLADDAARQVQRSADDLWQVVEDLPADTADAIKQAAADAFNAVSAAAKWAWQAAKHAAQAGIPGGAPIAPRTESGGASGAWKPQVRRQDRRKELQLYAILHHQHYWRLLSSYPNKHDNYAVPSWNLPQQWAWASLPGGTITHPPNECGYVLVENWSADIASAFERWSVDKTWLSTDPGVVEWSNIIDGDNIPPQDEPSYQDALARYEYAQRETVIAENVPLTDADCTQWGVRNIARRTTPEDRLLARGVPHVYYREAERNPLWGTLWCSWNIWFPKVTRYYWFFPHEGVGGKIGTVKPIPPLDELIQQFPGVSITGAKEK